MADARDHFRDKKFILLTSYKKDGSPVETQMWFVLDDGRLFIRTDEHHYKVRRIRRNPSVKVVPCDFTGKPFVEPFPARAVEISNGQEESLGRLFARKFPLGYYLEVGILRPLSNALARVGIGRGRGRPVFYEILAQALIAFTDGLDALLMASDSTLALVTALV